MGITGTTGSNITWIITDGSSTTATFQGDNNVKAAMQNVIGTTPTALTDTKYADFNASWFSVSSCGSIDPCGAARTSATPNSYAAFAYDAVYIAAKGIASAGTVAHTDADSKTLLNALYAVSFTGASGVIKFNNKGEVNGKYDFITLNNQTYSTFGKWDGTATFTAPEIVLPNNQTYILSGNKYYREGMPFTTSLSPSTTTSRTTTTTEMTSSTDSLPMTTSKFITTAAYSNIFYLLFVPAIFMAILRKMKRNRF